MHVYYFIIFIFAGIARASLNEQQSKLPKNITMMIPTVQTKQKVSIRLSRSLTVVIPRGLSRVFSLVKLGSSQAIQEPQKNFKKKSSDCLKTKPNLFSISHRMNVYYKYHDKDPPPG